MSKYNVSWNQKTRTLTIGDTDAKAARGSDLVSNIVYGDVGDIPDSASHPEPGQHLRNIARQQGVDDYDLVTVVNETDNDRLDRFVQEADKDKLERYLAGEKSKVLDKPTRHLEEKAIENADKVGPLGDRDDNDKAEQGDVVTETTAQKKAREKAEKDAAEKAGKAGGENGAADAKADKAQDSQDTVAATTGGAKSTT